MRPRFMARGCELRAGLGGQVRAISAAVYCLVAGQKSGPPSRPPQVAEVVGWAVDSLISRYIESSLMAEP
jgi:hypothetical protein